MTTISFNPATQPTLTELVWNGQDGSFRTDLEPALSAWAHAPAANRDLVRLAVGIFVVDRTNPRPRTWARNLTLATPVEDPAAWTAQAPRLATLLGFLTGDTWTLTFLASDARGEQPPAEAPPGQVALLSGGADSLCGALLHGGPDGTYVSHHHSPQLRGQQNRLVDVLAQHWDQPVRQQSFLVGTFTHLAGTEVPNEPTSRSRSMLFLAMGLLVAAPAQAALLVPENGFASLNPPLGAERIGSLSTRTTHPWFLAGVSEVMGRLGGHGIVVNPFARLTKGEMFIEAMTELGATKASALLSASHSCSRSDLRFAGLEGVDHCGVCFGCLVRSAAFVRAGLADATAYAFTPASPIGEWLTARRRADVAAAAHAVARGVDPVDLLAVPLPAEYEVDDAIDLAARGLEELGLLFR